MQKDFAFIALVFGIIWIAILVSAWGFDGFWQNPKSWLPVACVLIGLYGIIFGEN